MGREALAAKVGSLPFHRWEERMNISLKRLTKNTTWAHLLRECQSSFCQGDCSEGIRLMWLEMGPTAPLEKSY